MARAARLHLRRIPQWLSIFRKFRVLLDGQEIDRIQRGVTRTYEITPGEHELIIKIDWVSSPTARFRCDAGEDVRFVCGHPTPTWRAALDPAQLVSNLVLIPDDAEAKGEK